MDGKAKNSQEGKLEAPDPLDVVANLLLNLFWHSLSHLKSIAIIVMIITNINIIVLIIIIIVFYHLLLKNLSGEAVGCGEIFWSAGCANPPSCILSYHGGI